MLSRSYRAATSVEFPGSARLFRYLRVAIFFAALIGGWQLLYELEVWSPFLFPSPGDVWESLQRNIANGRVQEAVTISMQRMAIGFGLAFVIGLLVGILIGTFRWADETLGTLVVGLQSLPSITWLPLALLWFGLNDKAIIFVVLMGSVFAIAISARDGVRNLPPLLKRAAQTVGAGRLQLVRYVVIPGMLPSMAQGLKLGWSFAWRSLMAGELLFVSGGLGQLLNIGRELQNMSLVVAVMLVIVAIGLLVDRLVFAQIEGRIRERWGLSHN